ncbi:CHAP domain-containing protein [Fundicoccus sp. Sow4_H7]|uniref:CHAP domain-containing protein n=1 Tax=Fundicoccus sp. Sow4_H7 TaxID=3438784 RepID=UPI003F92F01B
MITAQEVLAVAEKYVGVVQDSLVHRSLIDRYNQVLPRPASYKMTYEDAWCDAFVSVVGDESGASHLIGRECGVQRHIELFKGMGIWLGRQKPTVGDMVCFDWDGGGFADHIGFVAKVEGKFITTIEGNSNRQVAKNRFNWEDWRIIGFARPKYAVGKSLANVVQEVFGGLWGNGEERRRKLVVAGYDYDTVQQAVNAELAGVTKMDLVYDGFVLKDDLVMKIVGLAKDYQILPSFLIVMLHYESLWGQSAVGRADNNWAGITWSATYVGNPGIAKSPGLKRPLSEGGYYVRYETVEDFLADWVYLLSRDHLYQVANVTDFATCVAGLFRPGGAKYDYAAVGRDIYLKGMLNRRAGIEAANPGKLGMIDREVSLLKSVDAVAEEVIQGKWFVGEARKIALTAAGYHYESVQRRVNALLRA